MIPSGVKRKRLSVSVETVTRNPITVRTGCAASGLLGIHCCLS